MVPGVHQELPGQPIKDVDLNMNVPDDALILVCFPHSLCLPCVWALGAEPLGFVHRKQLVSNASHPQRGCLSRGGGASSTSSRRFCLRVGSVLQYLVQHHRFSEPMSQNLLPS